MNPDEESSSPKAADKGHGSDSEKVSKPLKKAEPQKVIFCVKKFTFPGEDQAGLILTWCWTWFLQSDVEDEEDEEEEDDDDDEDGDLSKYDLSGWGDSDDDSKDSETKKDKTDKDEKDRSKTDDGSRKSSSSSGKAKWKFWETEKSSKANVKFPEQKKIHEN